MNDAGQPVLFLLPYCSTLEGIDELVEIQGEGSLAYELLRELNSVRENPRAYANKFRCATPFFGNDQFFEAADSETPDLNQNYGHGAQDAIAALEYVAAAAPLTLSNRLSRAALDGLRDRSSSAPMFGLSSDSPGPSHMERIGQYGACGGVSMESLVTGSDTAEGIVMYMLMDVENANRERRWAVLNPAFKAVGIASLPHRDLKHICAVIFSESFNEYSCVGSANEKAQSFLSITNIVTDASPLHHQDPTISDVTEEEDVSRFFAAAADEFHDSPVLPSSVRPVTVTVTNELLSMPSVADVPRTPPVANPLLDFQSTNQNPSYSLSAPAAPLTPVGKPLSSPPPPTPSAQSGMPTWSVGDEELCSALLDVQISNSNLQISNSNLQISNSNSNLNSPASATAPSVNDDLVSMADILSPPTDQSQTSTQSTTPVRNILIPSMNTHPSNSMMVPPEAETAIPTFFIPGPAFSNPAAMFTSFPQQHMTNNNNNSNSPLAIMCPSLDMSCLMTEVGVDSPLKSPYSWTWSPDCSPCMTPVASPTCHSPVPLYTHPLIRNNSCPAGFGVRYGRDSQASLRSQTCRKVAAAAAAATKKRSGKRPKQRSEVATIKAQFGDCMVRFTSAVECATLEDIIEETRAALSRVVPPGQPILLKFQDEDGDWMTLFREQDWQLCKEIAATKNLRMCFRVQTY
eukprot:CAMPEP_0184653520 /NCGR_PEP_ID=MMETSP0308-20130426/11241_1 /TAXON_ID=38269 /ORGANISM="Gloeochaete witrockiana, Strain SAG 46.84" /LENGTH=687 /DNA_ID=CAMNT_0027089025 /DNA_START=335 /DNA_END=2398 /DNA_ORIENTATION=-